MTYHGMEGRCIKGFDRASNVEKDGTQVYIRKKGKTMKYKVIRLISLQQVYLADDSDCEEFLKEFDNFLRWCFFTHGRPAMSFFDSIDFNVLEPDLEKRPKWRDFLIEHGFIEKVEEAFYSMGDHFRHKCGNEHMIARVGNDMVQLIRTDGMLFYGKPTEVRDVRCITKEEFEDITDGNSNFFTKMEEGK